METCVLNCPGVRTSILATVTCNMGYSPRTSVAVFVVCVTIVSCRLLLNKMFVNDSSVLWHPLFHLQLFCCTNTTD